MRSARWWEWDDGDGTANQTIYYVRTTDGGRFLVIVDQAAGCRYVPAGGRQVLTCTYVVSFFFLEICYVRVADAREGRVGLPRLLIGVI